MQDEPEEDMLKKYTETRIQRRSFLSKTLERYLTRSVPGPEKSWAEFDAWIVKPDHEGDCVSCRLHHGPPQGETKLVVIGDSTLRGALPKLQDVSGEGHIHWINISGLVIEEAFAVYIQWLGASEVPVHLLLIVGINNFLRNHSLGRMQLEFSRGLMAVEEMDNVMGRTGSSKTKVTLATLPMVPRALGVDDHGTINHLDSALTPRGKTFQELNGYILALNITRKESGHSPPRFHAQSVKSKMVRGRRKYQITWGDYRETRKSKKLHFNLGIQAAMIKKIRNWFHDLYPRTDSENNELDRSFTEFSFDGE